MKREPVNSETIAAIGYDSRRCELDLEFRASGDVYRYFQVTAEEHGEFMAAASKGTYLNQIFKSKEHRYVLRKSGGKVAP